MRVTRRRCWPRSPVCEHRGRQLLGHGAQRCFRGNAGAAHGEASPGSSAQPTGRALLAEGNVSSELTEAALPVGRKRAAAVRKRASGQAPMASIAQRSKQTGNGAGTCCCSGEGDRPDVGRAELWPVEDHEETDEAAGATLAADQSRAIALGTLLLVLAHRGQCEPIVPSGGGDIRQHLGSKWSAMSSIPRARCGPGSSARVSSTVLTGRDSQAIAEPYPRALPCRRGRSNA